MKVLKETEKESDYLGKLMIMLVLIEVPFRYVALMNIIC